MKAVQFAEHGDRDVIEYGEYDNIEPGRNEVRIEVKAGALNYLDVWTRRGLPGLDRRYHTSLVAIQRGSSSRPDQVSRGSRRATGSQ